MSAPFPLVTVHLLLGFLGVGKTTAMQYLLTQRPTQERWAILVNEFGAIGVDGQILGESGIAVKQVAGGCMCCASGPVTRVALNELIRRERPDRLLIEPSGLGHPQAILTLLQDPSYHSVLRVTGPVTLVDPRQVVQEKYQTHPLFQQQVMLAAALVMNKADLVDDATRTRAKAWLQAQRMDIPVYEVEQGAVELSWFTDYTTDSATMVNEAPFAPTPLLDWRSAPTAPNLVSWLKAERAADGFVGVGWRMPATSRWQTAALLTWLQSLLAVRVKALLYLDDGWCVLNMVEGALTVLPCAAQEEAVLEMIMHPPVDSELLEQQLRAMLTTPS